MTTKTNDRLGLFFVLLAIAAASVFAGAHLASGDDSPDVKCAHGFVISDSKGNEFTGTGDVPPGGASIADNVSGDGSSYSVVTDKNGTTLNVHTPGRFRIACK
jgi:hypothetical protein